MVSIVIVNYKQKNYTVDCAKSIYQVIHSVPFEIIVVNNSPEDDFSPLEKHFANFSSIKNENKGYSQANNLGVKHSKYDHILFLNADTVFVTDPFADLFRFMEKRNYGAIGLKLFNKDNTFQLSFGVYNDFQGESENKSKEKFFREKNLEKILEVENSHSEISTVEWVTGAAMLLRKKVFNEVNGFNERFFLYYEDAELCKRFKDKGYQNYFYPFSKIIHFKGENVNNNFNDSTYYYSKESQILFYKLHNSFLNNFFLRVYLFVKFFFLSIFTFKRINWKILKLSITGV